MKVALVHYWLFHMRGGEKVLEALCELYPDADIYTHLYDPAELPETITRHKVRTTFIQRLPFARRLYQKYLPLMPFALECLDLTDYDLVISSESGPAKGVITRPDSVHVCYCHSPMRYLWDQTHLYRRNAGFLSRLALQVFGSWLRLWDVSSAARVDHFIANSAAVAARVRKFYRREATVIHPPCDVDSFDPATEPGEFFLYVGELVSYKQPALAVAAFNRLQLPLVIIGGGEQRAELQRMAGPNVSILGKVPFAVLKDHYRRCRALIFPGEEDFGIVPVEAMASGRPVIAFARGGALDTVVDGVNGLLFREQSVDALVSAVERFQAIEKLFQPADLARHAQPFHKRQFQRSVREYVDAVTLGGQAKVPPPSDVAATPLALEPPVSAW